MSELQGHQVDTNGTDFSWMNVIAVKQATETVALVLLF